MADDRPRPFLKFLARFAPTVLTAVGGPAGAMAGALIKKAMGVDDGSDVHDALEAASETPEGVEKIKLAEIELKKFEEENGFKFEELQVRREEIAAGDRDSARKMAMIYGSKLLTPQNIIAALFLVGYLAILGLFFRKDVDVPMDDVFKMLLGVLTAGVSLILGFYFGSTANSHLKTNLLATGKDEDKEP